MQQQIDRLREEKRGIALLLILPKHTRDDNLQFPGPARYALRLASD